MKRSIINVLIFVVLWAFVPVISVAGSAAPKAPEAIVKTKKELRKEKRTAKITNFIQKRVEKRMNKIKKKQGKNGFSDLDRNLQLAIIFGAGAIALSILGSLLLGSAIIWTLASLAWLVGIVFLVLWIVENA